MVPGVNPAEHLLVLPGVIPVSTPVGARNAVHTARPTTSECTCGLRQDYLVLCRHACAVLKQHCQMTWEDIQNVHVHPYYTCGSLHQLYSKNIFQACLDNLEYDGMTYPPLVRGRAAGRPKSKRMRRRSEYADPSESKVWCSACKERRGHNKRTCTSIVGS